MGSGAGEQPRERRNIRISDYGPRIVKVCQLPISRMRSRLARQVRTNTPRAPEVRVFVASLPSLCRLAPASPVRGHKSHLLRMTVSTTFTPVNHSAAPLPAPQLPPPPCSRLPPPTPPTTSPH